MGMSADAIAGDVKNAVQITLAYNNAAALTPTRKAAEVAQKNYGAGLTVYRNLRRGLDGKTRETRVLVTLARDILKPRLGNSFSLDWVETGFLTSLEVPQDAARLETLIGALANYFTKHPEYESDSSDVTASALEVLHEDLATVRQEVKSQTTNLRTLSRLRREKFAALRKQLCALAKELTQKLSPLDERWCDYGFNIPGLKQKPEAPEEVSVTLLDQGAAAVEWEPAARADYYRVWLQILGVDAEPVPVGSPADPNFLVESVPQDAEADLFVSAVNKGGESRLSAGVRLAPMSKLQHSTSPTTHRHDAPPSSLANSLSSEHRSPS